MTERDTVPGSKLDTQILDSQLMGRVRSASVWTSEMNTRCTESRHPLRTEGYLRPGARLSRTDLVLSRVVDCEEGNNNQK